MARHDGMIPSEKKALLALPGIGRYTAGAILSLAFGQREPVLDGNVRRVLCRVYDIADDPAEAATERQLWQLATELVIAAPEDAAGDLNEGLMELGALICTPGKPDCAACPLAGQCLAHARGVEAERPAKQPRARPPHYDAAAAVISDEADRYLLIQRPSTGLLGGLWGFPGGVLQEGEVVAEGLVRTVHEQIGLEVGPGDMIARIRHAYTHFRITLHAYRCRIIAGEPQPLRCAAVRWVAVGELTGYALPVTDAKIVQALQRDAPPTLLSRSDTLPADHHQRVSTQRKPHLIPHLQAEGRIGVGGMAHLDLMQVGQGQVQDAAARMRTTRHNPPCHQVVPHCVGQGPVRIEDLDVLRPDVSRYEAAGRDGLWQCDKLQAIPIQNQPIGMRRRHPRPNRLGMPMISATCGLAG